jgi:hypothetical protein
LAQAQSQVFDSSVEGGVHLTGYPITFACNSRYLNGITFLL